MEIGMQKKCIEYEKMISKSTIEDPRKLQSNKDTLLLELNSYTFISKKIFF